MVIFHHSAHPVRWIIKQRGFSQPLTQSDFLPQSVSYSVSFYSVNNYQTTPYSLYHLVTVHFYFPFASRVLIFFLSLHSNFDFDFNYHKIVIVCIPLLMILSDIDDLSHHFDNRRIK